MFKGRKCRELFHFGSISCLNSSLHGEIVLQIDGECVVKGLYRTFLKMVLYSIKNGSVTVIDVKLEAIEEVFLVLYKTFF